MATNPKPWVFLGFGRFFGVMLSSAVLVCSFHMENTSENLLYLVSCWFWGISIFSSACSYMTEILPGPQWSACMESWKLLEMHQVTCSTQLRSWGYFSLFLHLVAEELALFETTSWCHLCTLEWVFWLERIWHLRRFYLRFLMQH